MSALQCSDSASSFASSAPTTDSSLSTHAMGDVAVNSVTPTKSLTPRYQPTYIGAGAAAALVPTSRLPPRREARHRFVEGGAPAERYLEPLPHHHPHSSHHLSKDTSNGHYASAASLAASSRSLTMGASPMYRNLVVSCGAGSPGGSSSPVHLSSTVTAAGGTVGSSSCITLRPLAAAGGSGGDSGHQNAGGPLSIESRMFPSPLAPSLGPASPSHGLLPHPPSLSSLSGLRSGTRHPPGTSGSSPQGALPQLPDDIGTRQRSCESDEDTTQPLAALLIGSASVPPLAMHRVDSIIQTTGGAGAGGPASPMGSFRRQRLPRRPGTLPLEDEDDAGSDSSAQASPYSSWRLDGSAVGADFGTPRTTLSVSPGMQVANWSDALCQPGATGGASSSPLRLGSPRRTSLLSTSLPPQAPSPTSTAQYNSVVVPVVDSGISFWFLPRDANTTIDSLDDNEVLQQGAS